MEATEQRVRIQEAYSPKWTRHSSMGIYYKGNIYHQRGLPFKGKMGAGASPSNLEESFKRWVVVESFIHSLVGR